MNRKKFIQSHGADCKNWNWSWSFVNHSERFVIFGIWHDISTKKLGLILHKEWESSPKGRRNNGYGEAIEHISLIENNGYQLRTFQMKGTLRNPTEGELSASRITSFTEVLVPAQLISLRDGWYAGYAGQDFETIAEIVGDDGSSELFEGAFSRVLVNAYERNPEARQRCLRHFGSRCRVCDVDFGERYGALGEGYIHVHHIKPIHQCGGQYKVDPIKDLIPVCANCHAMIHRRLEPLSVLELREILEMQGQTALVQSVT